MRFVLNIDDSSSPEAKAFLEYVKTLKFVEIDEEEVTLSPEQIKAIEEARESIQKNGSIPHSEAMSRMKKKYPHAFRS